MAFDRRSDVRGGKREDSDSIARVAGKATLTDREFGQRRTPRSDQLD